MTKDARNLQLLIGRAIRANDNATVAIVAEGSPVFFCEQVQDDNLVTWRGVTLPMRKHAKAVGASMIEIHERAFDHGENIAEALAYFERINCR